MVLLLPSPSGQPCRFQFPVSSSALHSWSIINRQHSDVSKQLKEDEESNGGYKKIEEEFEFGGESIEEGSVKFQFFLEN